MYSLSFQRCPVWKLTLKLAEQSHPQREKLMSMCCVISLSFLSLTLQPDLLKPAHLVGENGQCGISSPPDLSQNLQPEWEPR